MHACLNGTTVSVLQLSGWIHTSPRWARWERPYTGERKFPMWALESWHIAGQSPKKWERGIKWSQSWSCQGVFYILTSLMMSALYHLTTLRVELLRNASRGTCGLSPVKSTNCRSRRSHFLHSGPKIWGLNLCSVQNLETVSTKIRPLGKRVGHVNSNMPFLDMYSPHTYLLYTACECFLYTNSNKFSRPGLL